MPKQTLIDYVIRTINYIKLKLFPYSGNFMVKFAVRFYYKYLQGIFSFISPGLDNTAMLALTYDCHCQCVHCSAAGYKQENTDILHKKEIFNILNKLKQAGVSLVYFFGGEPLLVPDLNVYVEYAKKNGMLTMLDTNGFMLDQDKLLSLKKSGLDIIGISIDSPHEQEHDKLRGVPGLYQKAIKAIKLCKKYDMECYISTYVTKESLKNGDLEKIIEIAEQLGVRLRILSPIMSGRWNHRDDLVLNSAEKKRLRSFLKKDKIFWETYGLDEKNNQFFCHALKKMQFYISAYGDIQPCCFLPLSFGNLRQEDLKSILTRMWSSLMFKTLENFSDCPLNNQEFRKQFCSLIEGKKQFPVRIDSVFCNQISKEKSDAE